MGATAPLHRGRRHRSLTKDALGNDITAVIQNRLHDGVVMRVWGMLWYLSTTRGTIQPASPISQLDSYHDFLRSTPSSQPRPL